MEWTWPERVTSKRKRVMEELVQGREMANQLREVIGSDVRSAEALVTKILGSLSNTLLILNHEFSDNEQEVISHPSSVVTTASGSSSGGDVRDHGVVKSEDSIGENCKAVETLKDRILTREEKLQIHGPKTVPVLAVGKTSKISGPTLTKDASKLVDDGYAWRKYGQKMILHSLRPRSYFRCTHKFDQGCKATKHVQTMEDHESQLLFRTTYIGNHTCTNHSKSPELVLGCSSQEESSRNMIRFDIADNAPSCKQEHPFFTSIKRECVKEEEVINPSSNVDHMNHYNQSSILSSDYLMTPVFGVVESSGDPSDVISRVMAGYFFDNEFDFSYEF